MKILFTKLFPTSVLQEKMKVKWCLEGNKAQNVRLRRAKKQKHYKNIDSSPISFQRQFFFGKIGREAAGVFVWFFFGGNRRDFGVFLGEIAKTLKKTLCTTCVNG